MPVSNLTAMLIQSNEDKDLKIDTYQSPETNKFGARLTLMREEQSPRLLISTKEVFENEEIAKSKIEDIIKEVRALKENLFDKALNIATGSTPIED